MGKWVILKEVEEFDENEYKIHHIFGDGREIWLENDEKGNPVHEIHNDGSEKWKCHI